MESKDKLNNKENILRLIKSCITKKHFDLVEGKIDTYRLCTKDDEGYHELKRHYNYLRVITLTPEY